jgi:hypothetical protein
MFNALNTKLLVIVIALLASIASYLGYEKHKQDMAEKRAQQLFRPMRPDEKQAIDGLKTWGQKSSQVSPQVKAHRMRKFLLILAVAPLAQAAGPADYIGSITDSVNILVTSGSPVFLATGNQVLTAVGIIMLVLYGLKWATHSSARHHPEFPYGELARDGEWPP